MLQVGKTALVTGSGRGIGRAIALRLAKEGAYVVVNFFRNQAPAEETAEQIRSMGRKAGIRSSIRWRRTRRRGRLVSAGGQMRRQDQHHQSDTPDGINPYGSAHERRYVDDLAGGKFQQHGPGIRGNHIRQHDCALAGCVGT